MTELVLANEQLLIETPRGRHVVSDKPSVVVADIIVECAEPSATTSERNIVSVNFLGIDTMVEEPSASRLVVQNHTVMFDP